MANDHLRAVEALLRNCGKLAIDAQEQAADGGEVLQHRLSALAGLIFKELAEVRALIAARSRRAAG